MYTIDRNTYRVSFPNAFLQGIIQVSMRTLVILLASASAFACAGSFPETNWEQIYIANLVTLEPTRSDTAPPVSQQTPDSVSSLAFWYKADALGLANNSAVGSWTDASGNGRHAVNATGAEQPVYQTGILNAKPALYFDGTDDYLQNNDVAYTQMTYVAVAKMTTSWNPAWGTFGYRMNVLAQYGDNPQNASQVYFNWAEVSGAGKSTVTLRTTVEGYSAIYAGSEINQNQWYLLIGTYDGQYSRFFLDGTLTKESDLTPGSVRNASIGFSIGRHTATSGNTHQHRFQGYIPEILFYTKALSTAERQGLECYLSLKYNLTVPQGCY
ncbi:MAG: LamG domain-containing protein [Leptospiraceae bacterium]|nr:LamG domain-containing protein [Leptospiraceae bacterium]